jgi:hypothetical protein
MRWRLCILKPSAIFYWGYLVLAFPFYHAGRSIHCHGFKFCPVYSLVADTKTGDKEDVPKSVSKKQQRFKKKNTKKPSQTHYQKKEVDH